MEIPLLQPSSFQQTAKDNREEENENPLDKSAGHSSSCSFDQPPRQLDDNHDDDDDDINGSLSVLQSFDIDYDMLVRRMERSKWYAVGAGIFLLLVGCVLAVWHMGRMDDTDESEIVEYRDMCLTLGGVLLVVALGMRYTENRNESRIRGTSIAITRRGGLRRNTIDEHGIQTTTTWPLHRIARIELSNDMALFSSSSSVSLVRIYFASSSPFSSPSSSKPLDIEGLVDAKGFLQLVNEQKRSQQQQREHETHGAAQTMII